MIKEYSFPVTEYDGPTKIVLAQVKHTSDGSLSQAKNTLGCEQSTSDINVTQEQIEPKGLEFQEEEEIS